MIDFPKALVPVLFALSVICAGSLHAQSEAESSAHVLEVRSDSEKGKLQRTYHVGDRVKVKLNDDEAWTRGHLEQIEDSSLTIGQSAVPISAITQFKSHPDWGLIWLGNFFALLMLASGFGTGLLIRAMVKKQPIHWYQWVLVSLGVVAGILLLLPLFFVGAVICWAFSKHHYFIRATSNRLVVRHLEPPLPSPRD